MNQEKGVLEAQIDKLTTFYYAQLETLEFYKEVGDEFNYNVISNQCEEIKNKIGELTKRIKELEE